MSSEVISSYVNDRRRRAPDLRGLRRDGEPVGRRSRAAPHATGRPCASQAHLPAAGGCRSTTAPARPRPDARGDRARRIRARRRGARRSARGAPPRRAREHARRAGHRRRRPGARTLAGDPGVHASRRRSSGSSQRTRRRPWRRPSAALPTSASARRPAFPTSSRRIF